MKNVIFAVVFLALSLSAIAQDVPKEIRGGILNGKAMALPKPEYPEAAKSAGLEGVVYVNVVIDEAGNVVSAVADDQPGKIYKTGTASDDVVEEQPVADIILRDAAERAAWHAKFSPTLLSKVPVRVTGTIVYNFVAPSADERASEKVVHTSGTGTINGGVLNSKALSLPKPEFPEAAKAVGAQGAVSVSVVVDEVGNVVSASAVSGHPLLRAASVKAAREAKFSPTLMNGQPVKFTGVLVYNFVAPDPKAEN